MPTIKAPFPWFGGKSRVAPQVWAAIGDVDNYVEPFAGSLAVLLGRPEEFGRWQTGAETVNDADCYLANFWRALAADSDEVAHYADWPVNEADLHARHVWLVNEGRDVLKRIEADPDFYDTKIAGWWVWGLCSWIGSGWCSGIGPWFSNGSELVKGDAGQGVHRKLPHLGAGRGVHRQLPHLGAGRGVHRQLPHLGDALADYLAELSQRLRRVRVVCGDWSRVCTNGALSYGKTKGVFLDPPYLGEVRCKDLYRVDDHSIAHVVRQWCLDNGDNPRYRIVLAGYRQEHDDHLPATWRRMAWSASGGYASSNSKSNDNRHNEMLWFSPHCLPLEDVKMSHAEDFALCSA